MRDFEYGFYLGIALALVTSTAIYLFAIDKKEAEHQNQAIENGCAYYSPMTGEFEWGRIK